MAPSITGEDGTREEADQQSTEREINAPVQKLLPALLLKNARIWALSGPSVMHNGLYDQPSHRRPYRTSRKETV